MHHAIFSTKNYSKNETHFNCVIADTFNIRIWTGQDLKSPDGENPCEWYLQRL